MGLRDRWSNYLYRQAEKRGWFEDIYGRSIQYSSGYVSDDNILQSSDVYELLQDISNQLMLAKIVVEDASGAEIKGDPTLDILEHPNNYLSGAEFIKLMANLYLLQGEVYPVLDGDQLHLATNIETELDSRLVEHYKIDGQEIPGFMIRHIKNIGDNHLKGVGLLALGKRTLTGVTNAEKALNDKYAKGGLLAYLIKLDAHINPQNPAQSKLINAIQDQLEQISDIHSTKLIPLGKGYLIDTLKSSIEDDKILAYLNVYKKDLGKFLGVNVNTYTDLTKSDLEKAMMYLHNKAVKPIMRNFETHLSALFFGKQSAKRIRFKINILDFVPYSTKTNIAFNLVRTMVAVPDDVREMLGFDKLHTPQSSELYVSKDLVAVKDLDDVTQDSLKGGDGDDNSRQRGKDV